jgi:hypothetical protein
MNNPHQALIEETKLKLVNTFVLSDDSWDVILQATIDTVLEEERERTLEILTTTINANQMLRGWERYWKEVEPNRFVENCIECENTSRILKALDKIPLPDKE